MDFPNEYIDFLVHFHGDRDYFECHEIMEEYWKKVDKKNKESIWVGFIQLAVANYHHRRGNFTGAYRTLKKSLQLFTVHKGKLIKLGIDSESMLSQINQQLLEIKNNETYRSLSFPILSKELVEECISRCKKLNMEWQSKSDTGNFQIVHRHLWRDRTEVINNRQKALQKKSNKRQ